MEFTLLFLTIAIEMLAACAVRGNCHSGCSP